MSLAHPAGDLPPTTAEDLPDDLPDDLATLKRMVLELLVSLHDRDRDIEALRHRLDLLLRRLCGPRGERINPDQLLLFAEPPPGQDTAPAPPEPAAAAKPKRRCRPHGRRRRLPVNLPREFKHHELSEADRICQGCGQPRIDIGADRSEQLDYRPASLFVVEHIVHKYVCPCCSKQRSPAPGQQAHQGQESDPMAAPPQRDTQPALPTAAGTLAPVGLGHPAPGQDRRPQAPSSASRSPEPCEIVIVAPKPAVPIAKGLPGPGLLAHLIVSKYTDHMPLHRLERSYER